MAPTYLRLHQPGASRIDSARTFIAYGLIGFTNILLQSITFACAYLIIPFPRIAVLFIEGLPALAAKLLFPHLIRYIPHGLQPLILASCWALCAIVTWATPPNVEPPVRVLIVLLAAATAAATDVVMLGMLRFYGNSGLSGWAVGTGIGYIAATALPFVVTEHFGGFLRSANDYTAYFILAALAAHYLLLPNRPRHNSGRFGGAMKPVDEDTEDEAGTSLLVQDPPQTPRAFKSQVKHNCTVMIRLFVPYMWPLYTYMSTLSFFFPALVRAQPESSSFTSFMNYATAYGFAIHIGNFLGRSTILFKRFDKFRHLELARRIIVMIVILNTVFVVITNATVLIWMAALIGFVCGAAYIQTLGDAIEAIPRDHDQQDQEFSFGIISAGDTLGVLGGGLFGALVTSLLCAANPEDGQRWCHFAS